MINNRTNSPDNPATRAVMDWSTVDAVLDRVETLPPSPYPLPELFRALTNPDTSLDRVVEIITFDQVLTAKLLQLCNSAFFCGGRHVNDVEEAISRLGFQMVYRVVAGIRGPQLFQPKGGAFGFSHEALWKHSVLTALNAQFMGEDFGEDSGMLFTAGLLHDLGKVILGMAFREKYGCVVAAARREEKPLWETERSMLGVDHATVGARLLERWRFSPELVCSVRCHHAAYEAGAWERFPAIIQVASTLSHEACPEAGAGPRATQVEAALAVFGWSIEELGRYAERMKENRDILNLLLRMGR